MDGWTTDGGGSWHSSSPLQQILPLPSHPKWVSTHPLPPFPGCLVPAPTARAGLPSLSLPICSPLSLSGASLCSSLSLEFVFCSLFPLTPLLLCVVTRLLSSLPRLGFPPGPPPLKGPACLGHFPRPGCKHSPRGGSASDWKGTLGSPGPASRVVSLPVPELLCRRQAHCLPPCPAWTTA